MKTTKQIIGILAIVSIALLILMSGCISQDNTTTQPTTTTIGGAITSTSPTIVTTTTALIPTTTLMTTTIETTTTIVETTVTTVTTATKLRVAEISLPGMFCSSCAAGAEWAFKNMKGVRDAKVNFGAKKGIVIYDSSIISKEELLQNALIQAYEGKILSDKEYKR